MMQTERLGQRSWPEQAADGLGTGGRAARGEGRRDDPRKFSRERAFNDDGSPRLDATSLPEFSACGKDGSSTVG
jgi:hypothetical protein